MLRTPNRTAKRRHQAATISEASVCTMPRELFEPGRGGDGLEGHETAWSWSAI